MGKKGGLVRKMKKPECAAMMLVVVALLIVGAYFLVTKNKLLGVGLGILNGIIILALTISIFKEILAPSFGENPSKISKSVLYQNIDLLQQKYLIQYKEVEK